MKRLRVVLGLLVLVAVPAWWWLLMESGAPTKPFVLDLAKVRALAGSVPGERPTSVHVERVGSFEGVPSTAVLAGSGLSRTALTVYAYQVVFPDRGAVVVDTGYEDRSSATFDAQALGRVQAAMTQASLVVVTHEHFDHLGGLTTHPALKEVLAHTKLTPAQLAHPEFMDPAKWPPGALEGYVPAAYEGMSAVAPGVVLIAAPGHTPGSQLVYVQQADGLELLFLGDVAWKRANVETGRERARLVTLLIKEDRDAVLAQLQALSALHEAAPTVRLVPGHDAPVIEQLVAEKSLVTGFLPASGLSDGRPTGP